MMQGATKSTKARRNLSVSHSGRERANDEQTIIIFVPFVSFVPGATLSLRQRPPLDG